MLTQRTVVHITRRTRNSDFESIYAMLQQKEDETKVLKQQVCNCDMCCAPCCASFL